MLGRTDRSEWRTHRIYAMLTDWENGRKRERENGQRDEVVVVAVQEEKEEEGKKGKEGSYSGAFRKGRGRQQVGTQCHK